MHVLVIGGTGTVGSQVVRELTNRTADVSVLTRDAAKAADRLPRGVKTVEGDLVRPDTVRRIFDGVDAVFLLNAMSPSEAHEGLSAVTGMRHAGVQRVVYLSVQDAPRAAYLPHFGAKVGVEKALEVSGIPYTILRPNNFFQNDLWLKDVLLQHHVYPTPLGDVGVSRVDVRDIAELAAMALVAPGGDHEGQTYDVMGPEPLTGEETARRWSRALGTDVAYVGGDLDAWEQQARQMLPDYLVFEVREMWDFFMEHGLEAAPGAVERVTALLGHAPRSFDAFARETAAAWKGASS